MSIYEVASWTASDALLKDKATLKAGMDHSIQVKGCLGGYYGLSVEDKKTANMFIPWEKYEHHKALIDNPVEYPIIMAKLKPAIGRGNFLMSHVQFNDDATAALTAPVTEIVGITLKDGHAKQELDDVLRTLKTIAALGTGSFSRAVWGPTIEDASKFWLVIGWQSVEAHYDVVSQEESGEIVKALGRIANYTLGHVSFWDHTEIIRAAPEGPLASL